MNDGASSYHRFLQGDKSGLEEIVKIYNNSLIFFINGFVNNISISEDLAADTFLELLIKKNRYKNNASFKTWLFKIGRNNAIDYLRKHSNYNIQSIEDLNDDLKDRQKIEDIILINEQQQQIHKALSKIKLEYKEVLHLIYFEGMSYDEAAIVLRKSNKQIKNLVYRARQALKLTLEKEGFVYEEL